MKICGIELKGNDTILAVIEVEFNIINYISLKLKKISIQNDEDKSEIESFHETIKTSQLSHIKPNSF